MARSRAAVWGKRLLLTTGATGLGLYGGFNYWIRQYDPGLAGPPRRTRVLVDEHGNLVDKSLSVPLWRVYLRILVLSMLFLPLILTYHLSSLTDYTSWLWQEAFVYRVQNCGPAFIKLAQWLATRRDLTTPEFRKVLSRLFNRVQQHSIEETRRIIREDIGDPDEIFSEIEPQVVGSGSIGQVHRAVLKDGRRVAVKVSHPNVREDIAVDFYVLNHLAAFVDRFVPSVRYMLLPRLAVAWTTHLAQQIDLTIEAENLDFFIENFKGADTDRFATFPDPIRPYVSARVLVETLIDGHEATDEYLHSLPMELRTHIAEIGMDTYMKNLLKDNWLHGDLHPGNIMITEKAPPGKKWPVVYLIDCGLCQNLEPEEAEVATMVLEGFAKWKDETLAQAFWRMGMGGTQRDELSYDELLASCSEIFSYYQASKGSDHAIVGRLLESMFDVVRFHKLQLEPGYTSLLFGALVQENFIMTLDERFNITQRVIPWLAGQGIVSQGMFKNFTGLFPSFMETQCKKEELGEHLDKKGLLSVEGGVHKSIHEERQSDKKEEWKRGVLAA